MKLTTLSKKSPVKKEVKENSFPVVAIGASAGGLEAMMELLKHLPPKTGMAFIYVQHLSPDHKSLLTEILSKKTQMKVQEIDDMDLIQPDNLFIIPYNKGIEVTDGHIKLIPRSETSAAISIDILFSTLAEAQKERVIGIILSGSASDGTLGMKAIKQEGGLTFAQNDTAKFNSMPHSAIAAGAVDFILSPKEIALELGRLSKHPLIKTVGVKNGEEDLIDNNDPDLKIILNQLHKVTGVDFSVYKMNTIKRRIIRRMLLYKTTQINEYAKLLSQKKPARIEVDVQSGGEEIDILYQDLLINVTSFFRDTETHHYLKDTLFPKLLIRKKTGESLRIWVPACATGEEVYSIAMMLLEIQESKETNIPVQIFATDLSEKAISKARFGIYTKQELETVSPKRIQRFFAKADGGYRVNKALRDMCVFAQHNILSDPPFSHLDFISCCNLFIYFDNQAQKKAVNTFHYALNEDGFLMLGKSENISHSANLFTGFNKKYKIFSRNSNSGIRTLPALLPNYAHQTVTKENISETNKTRTKRAPIAIGVVNHNRLDYAIDAVLVSEFMPASVVINHQMEIVQFRGTTDLFLTHPKGKATFNILKMARPEIAFELRNAISKVIKSKQRFRKSGIEFKLNSIVKIIRLEIVPLEIDQISTGWNDPLLLILFTELEQAEIYSQYAEGGKNIPSAIGAAKDRRIKKLELELAAAHADALEIAQDQETFTEELQSANEEVVSSNEELQTLNEELETSKEEIESANEELSTTNQELIARNDMLHEAYEYSEAVFATIHEPMLVLDKNLRVKSANKTFYKTFKVKAEETEGILLYDLGNKQWNIPSLRELLEDLLPKNTHFHDFKITHTFPLVGEKTMLLNARRIIQKVNQDELILLAISDITEQAIARSKIESSEKRYNMMLMNSPFTFAVLKGEDLIIDLANERIKEVWGRGNDIEGKSLLEIMPEITDTPFPALLDEVRATGIPFHGVEVQSPKNLHGHVREEYFNFVFQPYWEADETISGITIIGNDVTEQVIAKRKTEQSEKKFKQLAELSPQKVWTADGKGNKNYFNETLLDYAGMSAEELKSEGWKKMIHPDDWEQDETRWKKSIRTGMQYQSESRFLSKDGEYLWHLTLAVPLKDEQGKVILWIGSKTEIQEQRQQKELLEVEVTNRTAELKQANEELLKMNKELEAFTYISSHDLQEPLRKIRTIAGRILEKENQNLSDSGKNYFHLMQNAAERMQILIQDLLAFSRLNMADRKFEITDLNISIEEVKNELKDTIAEKNVVIEVKETCDVKIIPFQFRQLMHNLISNALKFSNPNIPPHIIISSANKTYSKLNGLNLTPNKEYCHIRISDNGIGFEKEFAEKIFGVFQKLHAKDEYAGTGIGLAIVKKIVENHKGIILATSKLHIGTTFDIYIPA
jgi:two-component system, chemotaxis family, CheB/CheR fusion protein